MENKIKYMDICEFKDLGFLQEVNRQFFHPLGLALEVIMDTNGEYKLGGIWDYREDLEGILYKKGIIDTEKAEKVFEILIPKIEYRSKLDNCSEDGVQIY